MDASHAAVINRAGLICTGTAGNGRAQKQVSLPVERLPALVIGRAKEGNAGSIYSIREMRRASVVADEKVELAEQGGQPAQRRSTRQVDRPAAHPPDDILYCRPFISSTGKH